MRNRAEQGASMEPPKPPRRRRGRPAPRGLRVAIAAVAAARALPPAAASASATVDDDDDDDDKGSGVVSATLGGGAEALLKQFTYVGDAALVRYFDDFWSGNVLCNKGVFVLSKDGPANQNCMAALSARGFSCTCLDGFKKKDTSWVFHVARKPVVTSTPKKEVASTSTIPITRIAPFELTRPVTELNILGEGPDIEDIKFLDDVDASGSKSTAKLESSTASKASLTKVVIENINLDETIRQPRFFKTGLTELTLRHCNLSDGSVAFLGTYAGLTYLNLENNRFTSIPKELLLTPGLQQVFLAGNPIQNLTVTEKEFQIIKTMKVFNLDSQTSPSICSGSLKSAQNLQFCISESGDFDTTSPADAPESSASGTNKFLLIGAIVGCVVVVILIFLVVRKRSSHRKEEAFVKQETARSYPEDTLSFDHSKDSQQSAIDSSLLNDPIIITHRIPHNDVKVATCISRGGFGLVYSGTFNRRRVAIKRIRSELSADIKYIEAFLKEICLMASLSHPRIVEFVGVSWDSLRNLSAVTEFMERGDLRDVLHSSKERNARLSWDGHKSRIAMHIAEALTYLHSLSPKVIHRDLKSKNVLLDIDMTAKLSDFGVSRERRFEETHMTAGIGTAFWIAPEVLLGMDYDERADIFSFGVVLSEIDTDDYPYWNEKNPASGGKQQENVILRMVATGALRPEFSASCPRAILELAYECLDVDPLKRPTAAEIAYRLQQLIKSSPLTATSAFSTE